MLIQKDGTIPEALIELIRLNGLQISDKSPQAVNNLLQERWMKTNDETEGTLRFEIGGRLPTDQEQKLLDNLGFTKAMPIASDKDYDAVIFLGATIKAMARRLQYFRDMWVTILERDCGSLPFQILVGHRALNEKLEGKDAMPAILKDTGITLDSSWKQAEWPENEAEAVEFLIQYNQMDINYQLVIDRNVQPREKATTYSTAVQLFRNMPKHYRNLLVISSQPFCLNQLLTVKRAADEVGDKSTIDVCGPAAPSNLPLARLLDTVAKQLWEECKAH